MAISAEEGTHVVELMQRTRRFLDVVEKEEAEREREREEMLRRAAAARDENEGGLFPNLFYETLLKIKTGFQKSNINIYIYNWCISNHSCAVFSYKDNRE